MGRVFSWGWKGQGSEEQKPTVMRRVFDGGEGVIKGGREERSRERGVWVPFDMDVDGGLADDAEAGGDLS